MTVLLFLACARPPAPTSPAEAPPAEAPPAEAPPGLADGAACLLPTDCASGLCEGEGCGADTPGVCVGSIRACTRDLRPYCDCEGETFRTSGSCPNRRFEHRGACGEPSVE